MFPLVRKTLVRVGLFYTYGLFFAWIFTLIEINYRIKGWENQLRLLKEKINLKYNKTDEDYESFVKEGAETVMQNAIELDWTFMNSCGFVFAAITRIGDVKCTQGSC